MPTFVDKGIEMVAKLINGVSTSPFTYVALGSGTTAEANDQTALTTEHVADGLARASATCSYEAPGKAKWVHTFTASNDALAVNEIGIFNAASSGDMLMRHKYASTKTLDYNETLTVTVIFTEMRPAE